MHTRTARAPRGLRVTGAALLAVATIALTACSSAAAPTASDPDVQGAALVNQFFTILQQPDSAKAQQLRTFLAPEFQIVRDSGDQLGKDAYLLKPASVKMFTISDVVATQGGDVLVVSYRIGTEETINGVTQGTMAPRLSVFRWSDGAWHLAAHSNFGALPR